jgi:threonine dehydrogenase-like Zn-dependent dehydrogenase
MRIREVRLVGPRRMEIAERDLVAAPGQSIVEIAACGYCTTDVHKYLGDDPDVSLPVVLGHEASGIVFETNPPDKRIRPGMRVTGGFEYCFATHVAAPTHRLILVPDDVPMEHALGEPIACVVNVAQAANPEPGDDVVLIGCGAMGLMTLTLLARSAAASITAVDIRADRLALARELGATRTINAKETDAWRAIMNQTRGKGAEVVIEFSGSPAGFDLAANVVRYTRAKLLVPASHMKPATYDLWPLALNGTQVIFAHPAWSLDFDEDMRRGLQMLRHGLFPMDRLLTHRFTLEEAAQGMEMAVNGTDGYIKGLLVPNA